MAIDREKATRREIGRLAVERSGLKENTDKIRTQPSTVKLFIILNYYFFLGKDLSISANSY